MKLVEQFYGDPTHHATQYYAFDMIPAWSGHNSVVKKLFLRKSVLF